MCVGFLRWSKPKAYLSLQRNLSSGFGPGRTSRQNVSWLLGRDGSCLSRKTQPRQGLFCFSAFVQTSSSYMYIVWIILSFFFFWKDPKVEFVEVVRGHYRGGPRSKSYITFMAREKPDGPLVEYQAKAMVTLDRKRHPILCRPTPPTPNPP